MGHTFRQSRMQQVLGAAEISTKSGYRFHISFLPRQSSKYEIKIKCSQFMAYICIFSYTLKPWLKYSSQDHLV